MSAAGETTDFDPATTSSGYPTWPKSCQLIFRIVLQICKQNFNLNPHKQADTEQVGTYYPEEGSEDLRQLFYL